MANYAVDPAILQKYLPYKTQLDIHNNVCYVSLVAFMFLDTKILGVPIPFHINFEEVNLRFYVRHKDQNNEYRRGVVFIKEIVPRPALAFFARALYNENYVTMPMAHQWHTDNQLLNVEYSWKKSTWNSFKIVAGASSFPITPGSDEEFITEHYWGYTKVNELKTFEYRVDHPTWEIYPVKDFRIDVDFEKIYEPSFSFLKNEKPLSVLLAEGSEVAVKSKRAI